MTTRMYTRTILLALLTVCLCLGLQAGAAQADFELPAFDVTQDGTSFYPDATVDATGAVHFLWGDFSGLRTRTRGADGLLGSVKTVAPTAADAEHAADGAGNVQFVWRGSAGADWIVRTRRLNPDGTLGPTADLSSAGFKAWAPQLAFDAAGGIVFTWVRTIDTGAIVQARRMGPDGVLGAVKNISAAGDVGSNQVAVDDEGNAVLAWYRNDGSYYVSHARRWAADGTLGPIVDLSSTGAHSATVRAGMDRAGIAHFAYMRGGALLTRRMGVGGVLGPERDLRESPTDNANDPSLAVDGAGNAQFVWRVSASHGIQARRELPDGSLGPVQNLGQYSSSFVPDPQVALDAHGTAHHVWLTEVGGKKVVMARSSAGDGSLGALQQLSTTSSGYGGDAASPAVASGPSGRTVAVWTRTTDDWLELVQGAMLKPEPEAATGPASGDTSPTAGGGTSQGPLAESDRLAPKLSGLALKPARLVVRRRGRVAYALSEASRVVLRIVRRGATRRVVGTLRTAGVAGANRLTFRSRLRGRYLRPGRYQLVAVATDKAGNRSVPSRAGFRVIRR